MKRILFVFAVLLLAVFAAAAQTAGVTPNSPDYDSTCDTSLPSAGAAISANSSLDLTVEAGGSASPADSIFGPLQNPVLEISFTDAPYNHNMGIASDGFFYYTVNGGNTTNGMINKYDLQGNFVSSIPCNLDFRGIVYNRANNHFYVSTYNNTAVYKILDINAGTYELLFSNILQNNQGSIGISFNGQEFYDQYNGTVNVRSLQTGALLQTMTGFSYGAGNWGGNSTITADPDYLYTWDCTAHRVFVYNLNGTPVSSFQIANGDNGMSLSFIDGMMFVALDANYGTGTWYGYRIRNFITENVVVTLTPSGTPIQIPANGGSFNFNIAAVNNETYPVAFQVWTTATLPTGSAYGPILNAVVTLAGGGSLNRDRTQNVPGSAPAGLYNYNAYVGVYPNYTWDSDQFPFEKLPVADGNPYIYEWTLAETDALSGDQIPVVVNDFILLSASPNPFNPTTALSFNLPQSGRVLLTVYDISGREIASLADGYLSSGPHSIVWDAGGQASGVYFVKLMVDGRWSMVRKIVLMK